MPYSLVVFIFLVQAAATSFRITTLILFFTEHTHHSNSQTFSLLLTQTSFRFPSFPFYFYKCFHNSSLTSSYSKSVLNIKCYYITELIWIISYLQNLYGLGARRIGVTGLPPMGCLPAAITLFGSGSNQCIQRLNQDAMAFNTKLQSTSQSLQNRFSGLKLVVFDIYQPLLNMVSKPADNGKFFLLNSFIWNLKLKDIPYLCYCLLICLRSFCVCSLSP